MIKTLQAIKEAAERLSGMDFESIREAFNRRELHNWELERDAARKRNASIKRTNKKLPRGQKCKAEKIPPRPKKITVFCKTKDLYGNIVALVENALVCHKYHKPGDAITFVSGLFCYACRVRRIADKAAPILDCNYRFPVHVRSIADLMESLPDKANEYIRQDGK